MNTHDEFRVFIYNNNITAISTYCSEFTNYTLLSDEELTNISNMIYDFHKSLKIQFETKSYTMDIFLNSNQQIELIEFNSFGFWLSAGSCLFDWIDDYNILYGTGDTIVFRLAELE